MEPKLEKEGEVSVSGEDDDWSDNDQTTHQHATQDDASTQTFPPTTPFGKSDTSLDICEFEQIT